MQERRWKNTFVEEDSLISYDDSDNVIKTNHQNVEAKKLIGEDSLISYDGPGKAMEANSEKVAANIVVCKSKSFKKTNILRSNRVLPCGVKSEKRNSITNTKKFFTHFEKSIRNGFTRLLNNSGNNKHFNSRVFCGVPKFIYYK